MDTTETTATTTSIPQFPKNDTVDYKKITSVRLLIPSHVAGNIIGKGGEKIKRLRTSHPGAQIKVREAPPECQERIVSVESTYEDLGSILTTIISDISANESKKPELMLLFSDLRVGSIIGSKGTIISKLRKDSGCFIKAFMKKLPLSDERVVLCTGPVEKIVSAVKQIYEMFPKDDSAYQHFDPNSSFMMPRDPESGGYALNTGGIPYSSKKRDHPHEMPPPPPFRKTPRFDESWNPATSGFEENPDFSTGFNPAIHNLLAFFVMKYPFAMYTGNDAESYIMKEVTLDNTLAGCVIGDRGDRINEIRNTCGARINVGKNDSAGQGERLITIEGTQHQCNLAEYMLKCCVRSFSTVYQDNPSQPLLERKKLLPESVNYVATTF